MIKIVKFANLDEEKYERCTKNSTQKSIFCELNFLRAVNGDSWFFLIHGDYEAVMPVPFVHKFGIKIVTRPWGMQQCGIYSLKDSPELNEEFKRLLECNFTVNYYPFNIKNHFEKENIRYKNLSIPQNSYEKVRKNYTADRRRNTRILPEFSNSISLEENADLDEIKDFYFKNALGIPEEKKIQFWKVLKNLNEYKYLEIWILKFESQIASVAVLVLNESEIYTFSLINDDSFKKYNTPSILIDQILQKKIQHKKFSFMGGNLTHIHEFFRRFGALEDCYEVIQRSKSDTVKRMLQRTVRF